MIANALADKPLPVYGEGLNVCDWLYVEDHCKAIDLVIHKGRVCESTMLAVTTKNRTLKSSRSPAKN